MFPLLDACDIREDGIDKLVALAEHSGRLPNDRIPAGYTYLGQFIDHDITFDPTRLQDKLDDPFELVNFRTPRLDLDCLYGTGPSDQPYLYEWKDGDDRGVKLLVGANPPADADGVCLAEHDLPRNEQGRALTGDPRNDENLIISQLHLLFIRFHNAVVDSVRCEEGLSGPELFERARQLVRWHYQWVVVHDFLRLVVGEHMLASVLGPENLVRREFYKFEGKPFIPIEFSGAAYRFGHSMVRGTYSLKNTTNPHPPPIFGPGDNNLAGFRPLPERFELSWGMFFTIPGFVAPMRPRNLSRFRRSRKIDVPQRSQSIDLSFSNALYRLPDDVAGEPKLPKANMLRALRIGVPSGQAIAGAMGCEKLDGGDLREAVHATNPPPALARALAEATPVFEHAAPLWFYILCEAGAVNGGAHLGPVGGRIVAEVLLGLLEADRHSWLGQDPGWRPKFVNPQTGCFTMPDLVAFAGYDPATGRWPAIPGDGIRTVRRHGAAARAASRYPG